jgi:large subunit ribosomal protein L21
MYAIIETGGKQYWVSPGETIKVEKLQAEGKELTLDALWAGGDKAAEGSKSPKAKVVLEVLADVRAPKILVFKKRSKKAYKKMKGHRQTLTQVRVKSISFN